MTLAGFLLRQLYLVDHEAWWDEIGTATRSLLPITDLWTSLLFQGPSTVSADSSPPLHHIFTHFSLTLGQTGYFLKLPNSIFGALTIPAVYFLGKRLFNAKTGLYCAIYIAISAFHVLYSRDARWYSLFYFTTISSFTCFLAALEDNKLKHWAGVVFFSVAMLYTSYMAIVFLIPYCIIVAYRVVVDKTMLHNRDNTLIKRSIACFIAIFLLFLPWIPGQINAYHFLYFNGPRPEFSFSQLLNLLKFTVSMPYYDGFDTKFFILFVMISGVLVCILRKKYFGLISLCIWASIPLAAAYGVKTVNTINPRYVLFMLFVFGFFIALIASEVAQYLFRKSKNDTIHVLGGIAIVLIFSTLNLKHFPEYLVDGIFTQKPGMSWLAKNKYNAEYILFEINRGHKAIADWYIPKLFKQAEDFDDLAYKRCLLVSANSKSAGPLLFESSRSDFSFSRIGILNRSPLLIDVDANGRFAYKDDYGSFQAYTDASLLRNVAVSPGKNELGLANLNKSGRIVYSFKNPHGIQLKNITFKLTFVLERGAYIEPDCKISVLQIQRDSSEVALAVIDATHFPKSGGSIDRVFQVLPDHTDTASIQLAFEFTRGVKAGILSIQSFEADFELMKAPDAPVDAVAYYANNISKHASLSSWDENRTILNTTGLYAFNIQNSEGKNALHKYRRQFPNDKPVYTIKNTAGEACVLYFDPFLVSPFLLFNTGARSILTADHSLTGKSYILKGPLHFPTISSNGDTADFLLRIPVGALFSSNPGGQGRIYMQPLFTPDAFNPGMFDSYEQIKKPKDQNCLTCNENSSCSFTLGVHSIFPVTSFRAVWYPRIFSDQQKANTIDVLVSADGAEFKKVDSFETQHKNTWIGPIRKVSCLKFDKPANRVLVKFQMKSDATQLVSDTIVPMSFEFTVDTATDHGLALPIGKSFTVDSHGMDSFQVFYPHGNISFYDNLEYMH